MSELTTNQNISINSNNKKNYLLPLGAMTTLFFLWGFITVLNDILIPRLKSVFELSYTEAMLIQFCFFGAYFVVSLPAGMLVKKFGYKTGIIIGLGIASIGASLFYPAAAIKEYWIFLSALFVLASGITVLQVSANPYVAALGPEKSASSRLNLAQALNSLGTTLGPIVGSALFFTGTSSLMTQAAQADAVKVPYLIISGSLMTIALLFAFLKLPELHCDTLSKETSNKSLFKAQQLVTGVLAIFFYVGAEVSIGSFLVNYLGEQDIAGIQEADAAKFISYYWGGAMIGRFLGAYVMKFVLPHKLLAFNGFSVVALLLITMTNSGDIAMYSVLAIGFFNSIMFPTIFSLAITGLGEQTSKGSGWLCLAIVGGALIPLIQGVVADSIDIQISFVVPLLCYGFIIWFGCNVNQFIKNWKIS